MNSRFLGSDANQDNQEAGLPNSGFSDPEFAIDPEVAKANRNLPFSNPAALEMFEYGRRLAVSPFRVPDEVYRRVAAHFDHAQMTAVAASHALYELISAMAPRRG